MAAFRLSSQVGLWCLSSLVVISACGRSNSGTLSVRVRPEAVEAAQAKQAAKDASTCLEPAKVLAGVEYTCADGNKRKGMFLAESLPACSKDGDVGCVSSSSFPAVEKARAVPESIKSGVTLAGVAGSVVLKPPDCAADGSVGCVTTAAYKSATISGLAAKVLSTATVAGETGTVVLPGSGDVRSGVAFGAASALSGSYSPDFPDVANVRSSDTVNGAAGTLADCSADGATSCVVSSSGTIKAADTANFNGWDIRKKRNPTTGAVLTFAGLAGQSKTCRNRARMTAWNNVSGGTSPSAESHSIYATAGLDIYDTIDDYNNSYIGMPDQIPTWTVINSIDYGADYACGGIYATGNTATGNTGADASLAHDANGNWQDLTPGILPGGSNSTNTANGCNASDKHCVFKELISGLIVTEVSATTYTWANAISYCETLGESGHSVAALRSPIPAIGPVTYTDWRLPTQIELMHLSYVGLRGLNQTSNLRTFFGFLGTIWSSTTVSDTRDYAWHVHYDYGGESGYSYKNGDYKVICVR